jgi:hypothetical protein
LLPSFPEAGSSGRTIEMLANQFRYKRDERVRYLCKEHVLHSEKMKKKQELKITIQLQIRND